MKRWIWIFIWTLAAMPCAFTGEVLYPFGVFLGSAGMYYITHALRDKRISELEKANALLVQWKGEIDSYRIALRLPFPDDYDNSPKYAIHTLIQAAKDKM